MQNLVYKTYELNTDIEHKAKPINISGATTIRLTNIPSNVKCWISTESNGTNLYPLINRGDGWSNLPNPLYNLYIYTEGTTIDNEKIILNYTGQNDFFIYGNNSSERIDRIGAIDSFSDKSMIQLNNAIYNTYTRIKPIKEVLMVGEWNINNTNSRYVYFPFGKDTNLQDMLALDDDAYYRFSLWGHFDTGSHESSQGGSSGGTGGNTWSDIAHFSLIKNLDDSNVFTQITNQEIDNFYSMTKPLSSDHRNYFDIFGNKSEGNNPNGNNNNFFFQYGKGADHFGGFDIIVKGSFINQYQQMAISWKTYSNVVAGAVYHSSHFSLLMTISKAYSNILG